MIEATTMLTFSGVRQGKCDVIGVKKNNAYVIGRIRPMPPM